MQLIITYNKGPRFFIIFYWYSWQIYMVVSLKDKKGTNAFQKILNKSNCKLDKIPVDKDSKFYNRPMKSRIQDNDTEMYSTHHEEKSVVSERFIRTLTNKIDEYMNSILSNNFVNKFDDIFNKCNNAYNRIIKMKLANVKSSIYINFCIENKEKDPKFVVGDNVRISK